MRILQVITELRPAGAEKVVLLLSRELKKRGHELHVVSLKPLPEAPYDGIVRQLNANGIPVHSLGLTRAMPWRALRLRRLIRAIAPDIIHSHLFHPNLLTRLLRSSASISLVNTIHVVERRRSRIWHFFLDRLTRRRCDSITAVSQAVRDFHAPRIGAGEDEITVICNGVEIPRKLSAEQKQHIRGELGLADCTRIIGSIGRLAHQKGYDRLLGLLPELGNAIPRGETWGIAIIGEGPERPHLEKLAAKAPSNIIVRLPGFRSDAARCIQAFDLFVMPSRYEGCPMALLEACTAGVPAVISQIDSVKEISRQCSNAVPASFDQRSCAVKVLITVARQKLVDSSCSAFSGETMAEKYAELYRKTQHCETK